MSEKDKAGQTEGEKPEVKESGEKPATEAGDGKTYYQADVDNIVSKVKGPLEERLQKLEAEKKRLEEKAMTEDEKKAEQLRKEGRDSALQEVEAKESRWSIERAILSNRDIPTESIEDVTALVERRMQREGINTVDDAIADIRKTTPGLFHTGKQPPGGGGGRNSESGGIEYTPEYVQQRLSEPGGTEWYKQNRAAIEKWRRSRYGGGPSELVPTRR